MLYCFIYVYTKKVNHKAKNKNCELDGNVYKHQINYIAFSAGGPTFSKNCK